EHRSIPRCSTWNTRRGSEETALPRCSTWNIRRTDQAVDRTRASKAESEMFHVEHSTGSQSSTLAPPGPAMFHVEHSRVAMPMGCSTWNIFRGANPDVPRGTSPHEERQIRKFRAEQPARCSTWNTSGVRSSQGVGGALSLPGSSRPQMFHVEHSTPRSCANVPRGTLT